MDESSSKTTSSGSSYSGANSAAAWQNLEIASSFSDLLVKNMDNILNLTLPKYLKTLMKRKHLKQASIAQGSGQDKSYISQIFNGKKNPSRDILIAIAFGMHLNIKETQRALRLAGHTELHPTTGRDLPILYAIKCGMNIWEADKILYDNGFPTLL